MKAFTIQSEYSDYIQKAYYEYNACKDIIAFIMSKDNINEEQLYKYIREAEEKYVILELAKQEIITLYSLEEYAEKSNYHYDFGNSLIIFDNL